MALEVLAYPDPPTSTNNEDGGQAYNMGVKFTLSADSPIPGIEWRVPDTVVTPPGGVHVASLWTVADGLRVAAVDFTPTPGVKQRISFAAPYAGLSGVQYVAAVYTVRYVFTSGSGVFPASSGGGTITGTEGRLAANNAGGNPGAYPVDVFNSVYHVSPLTGTEGSSVVQTFDIRWQVRASVVQTFDIRWQVQGEGLAVQTFDIRWAIRSGPGGRIAGVSQAPWPGRTITARGGGRRWP